MKKLLFVCALLLSAASYSQSSSSEVTSEANWNIIVNCSIGAICVLFAVFLLMGLREIRRSFIPK